MATAGFLSHYQNTLTICLTPYNRKSNVLSASLNKTFPFPSTGTVVLDFNLIFYISAGLGFFFLGVFLCCYLGGGWGYCFLIFFSFCFLVPCVVSLRF